MPNHIYSIESFARQGYIDGDDPLLEELKEFRLGLLRNGYEPIPVRGKGGEPGAIIPGWAAGPITPERVSLETWVSAAKLNTGLRSGSMVVADNDLRDPEHAAVIDEVVKIMLGPTPLIRYGAKGGSRIYYNPDPITKLTLSDDNGKRLFEVLGKGQQMVGFGWHPDGMSYRWQGEDPSTVPLTELPVVTGDQLRALIASSKEVLLALDYKFKPDKPEIPDKKPPVHQHQYESDDEDLPALLEAAARFDQQLSGL
jgi:hypothetical protein